MAMLAPAIYNPWTRRQCVCKKSTKQFINSESLQHSILKTYRSVEKENVLEELMQIEWE